jgi:hypothetical protein
MITEGGKKGVDPFNQLRNCRERNVLSKELWVKPEEKRVL